MFSFMCSVLYITRCLFVSFPLAMILSVFLWASLWLWYCLCFCQLPFGCDIVCVFVSFPLAMILSVFLSASLWLWYCLYTIYVFCLPLWYLHTFLAFLRNCHMPVICVLKKVVMVYIFRNYMHWLLINCQGKFAILWEFYFLLCLVMNYIQINRLNGRHVFDEYTFWSIEVFLFFCLIFLYTFRTWVFSLLRQTRSYF